MRNDRYAPESYVGIRLWILVFFLLTAYISLYDVRLPHTVTAGISFGIFAHAWTVLLYAAMLFTGKVYWTGEIAYQEAAEAGRHRRQGYALKRLCVFLAGGALCCAYAYLRGRGLQGSFIRDSMAAAAVLCLSIRGAGKISL